MVACLSRMSPFSSSHPDHRTQKVISTNKVPTFERPAIGRTDLSTGVGWIGKGGQFPSLWASANRAPSRGRFPITGRSK